jgi:RNA polymerase sigma-70 factor (ECF subfamily)
MTLTSKQKKKQQRLFTIAHQDYEEGLKRHAFFKVHNNDTSEDLVQDTFIKTWSYLVKGGKIETMKAFLYHILNNLVVDEYRKHKTVSLDALMEDGFEPPIDRDESPFDMLDKKTVMTLMESLPEKYKKILKMKYVQELSLTEMSLITGQSKNAVTVQIHRGLKKLRIMYPPSQKHSPSKNAIPRSHLLVQNARFMVCSE